MPNPRKTTNIYTLEIYPLYTVLSNYFFFLYNQLLNFDDMHECTCKMKIVRMYHKKYGYAYRYHLSAVDASKSSELWLPHYTSNYSANKMFVSQNFINTAK